MCLQNEWLCLNCQTQRALSGQLADTKNVPQSSPIAAKVETQATPATEKADPNTAPIKSQHTPSSMKEIPTVPTPEPIMEPVREEPTTATAASTQIKLETTISKVSPVTEEKLLLVEELSGPTLANVQQTLITPKAEIPNTEVSKTATVEISEDTVNEPTREEDHPEVQDEAAVSAVSIVPVIEATAVPISCIATDDTVITEIETKPQVKSRDLTKSLPEAEVQPMSEPQLGPVREADIKEVADKVVEKIIGVTSSSEKQPVSTKDINIKVRMG